MLKEIRFYSRGGQGGVTGAKLLANAGSLEGLEVQAIPKYGAERKGSPIYIDVSLSDKPIKTHSPVAMADQFVILEPSLIKNMSNIRDDTLIILNAKDIPQISFESSNVKIGLVDAYRIAEEEHLIKSGTPLVSTIMLGAWCKATDEKIVSLKNILTAIEKYFSGTVQTNNINGIKKAFNEFKYLAVSELITN